MKAESRQ